MYNNGMKEISFNKKISIARKDVFRGGIKPTPFRQ